MKLIEGDRAAANLCRQFGDFVIGNVRRGIENVERAQSCEPLRLVVGDRERHDRFLCGRLAADSLSVVGDEPCVRGQAAQAAPPFDYCRKSDKGAPDQTFGSNDSVWECFPRILIFLLVLA